MISGLRDAVRESLLLKGFIGIMMISFGVWGVGDFIGTGGLDPSIAVRIGNSEITTVEFQRRFDQELTRFREQMGAEALRSDALKRSIADAMIQDITESAIVSSAAKELGIVLPMQRLQSDLLNIPEFQNDAGAFDQARFAELLYQANMSEGQFLEVFATDVRRNTIIAPVASNASPPEALVDNLFEYRNETRTADTLLVTSPALDDVQASEDELQALYEQNISSYTAPEYRKITALILEARHFQSGDDITEDEVYARYEESIDQYRTPGTRQVSQLIFDTQEDAAAVREQLEGDDDLTALAEKADISPPIDLGSLGANSPVARMMGDAYALPLQEISEPVQSDLGWHLFQITAETPEEIVPFDEVKDEVRQSMSEERSIDAVYEASVAVEDGVAGGTPLKEIAEFVGGDIIEIPELDRNGLDYSGEPVSEIFDRENFIAEAFAYPEGEASQLMDTPTRSGYYVLQIDKVTPPTPRPLDEVRDQVVNLWKTQTRAERAEKLAAELESDIGPSSSFSEIAASNPNVTYAPLGPITRFGEGLDVGYIVDSKRISPALLNELFSARTGTVVSAPVVDGFVIARVNQINTPAPEGDLAAKRFQLRTDVVNGMREDLSDQVVKAFALRYPVEINDEVINQLIELR